MAHHIEAHSDTTSKIVLIGAGTIGASFAALHLRYLANASQLTIYDPAAGPQTVEKISQMLQQQREATGDDHERKHHLPINLGDIRIVTNEADLPGVLSTATIVQEQGPETTLFKQELWPEVEKHAQSSTLLWSSTSGIPASQQAAQMKDPSRLIVVHPYNPPHIMPLLEVVPHPDCKTELTEQTLDFWRQRGRKPVVIHKEITGFVANRLAFALLREAIHLVAEGVVSAKDLDTIVTSSMGPRWAVAGPFESYAAGGGDDGFRGFMRNIGGTVQLCWDDLGTPNNGGPWESEVFRQTDEVYHKSDPGRGRRTMAVLDAAKRKS